MMSYEEFTQKEAALESAPRAEREAFYAEILEKETAKTDVRMMAYFHAALLHYREGDFRAAREILEPFVIDYQSYAYRPEIIACFNLMGVAVYCERSYALARFYIHEGLKIARENHETSRYSYEYNNLAVTYLAQHEYEKALEAIREAERHLPDSDREMHAYIYRNLSEICCHLDRLDEAQAALTRCVEEYDGRTLLPDDILLVEMLLYYKLGDAERYEKCRAEVWQKLPAMHAAEFGNTANNLFACEMDAGNYPQVERILAAMDDYLVRNPGESAVKAYDQAAPGTYQAILMDLMMPVMDGYAATRAIRSSGRPDAGTIPIIAMSANAYAEDVQKCLDTGMNAHISKPLCYKMIKANTTVPYKGYGRFRWYRKIREW